MAVTDFVYDNWGNITEIDMLYDDLYVRYELETSVGGVEIISEPIGWVDVTFMHKRDKSMHGFNYELTGTDFNLKFATPSGMEFVLAEYAANGNDGTVIFRRILTTEEDGGDEFIEFEGVLNLSTLLRSDYLLECQIERKSLHQLIGSRLNTKIQVDSYETLDQQPVPVYAYNYVALPGQSLSEKYSSSHTVVRSEAFTETRTNDSVAWILFDFKEPTVNTIKVFQGNTLGVSGDEDAVSDDRFGIFKFEADGLYDIDISLDFKVDLKIIPRFLGFGKKVSLTELQLKMVIVPPEGSGQQQRVYPIYNIPQWSPNTQNVSYPRVQASETFEDVEVFAGESMLIYAALPYGHNANKLKSVNITVKQYVAKLDLKGTSEAEPSIAQGRLIKPFMDAVFWRVCNETDNIKSNFYSRTVDDNTLPADGCGSDRMILNGAAVRNAPDSKFPISTTLSDMLNSLNAIDCIGMGYEWDPVAQRELIRIEPAEYFYRDIMIMELQSIFDYKEETAKDLIYNKLVFGYDKYKEEAENAYDEIHAQHEYQTPIKKESNEYSQLSKYNASGYLIEVTRRVKFEETPADSSSYDDDIFIIHVYNPGGMVEIFGPVTEEPFDAVSGVLDPETTLNMTLTPKRMLLAHGKWLMSSLIYKDAGEPIVSTFVKQNKEFTTTLNANACRRGDEALFPLRADENMLVGAMRPDLDGIYSPEWVWFKARLSMAKVRMIMNALRGLDTTGRNYGYIRYTNDLGVAGHGWVHEISYNRKSEEVSFKLLKKKFQ